MQCIWLFWLLQYVTDNFPKLDCMVLFFDFPGSDSDWSQMSRCPRLKQEFAVVRKQKNKIEMQSTDFIDFIFVSAIWNLKSQKLIMGDSWWKIDASKNDKNLFELSEIDIHFLDVSIFMRRLNYISKISTS